MLKSIVKPLAHFAAHVLQQRDGVVFGRLGHAVSPLLKKISLRTQHCKPSVNISLNAMIPVAIP